MRCGCSDLVELGSVNCKNQLLEIVGALGSPCCLARGLHGRQEQSNQDSDDRDDDEQFDQREARPSAHEKPPE